ncbi:hypothetical protein PIN17_0362 [Prevotella intermedia 17]|nr:hypothetical protein PIN17_0362 [Prevotella intermedia 17]
MHHAKEPLTKQGIFSHKQVRHVAASLLKHHRNRIEIPQKQN